MKKHKGIIAKRSLRPVKEKKVHKPDDVQQELQCAHCKTIFPDYLARCPECGSEEWTALVEVNPYSRIPMESIVKGCGHMLWMLGLFGFFLGFNLATYVTAIPTAIYFFAGRWKKRALLVEK